MFSHDIIKKRFVIFGANGMLGQRLIHFLCKNPNYEILGSSNEPAKLYEENIHYRQCDITKRENVKDIILDCFPDFIINAAAFTNVDLCETEREQAWKVNVKAVEYMAEAARVIDAHIIHISSDYIFDGANGPYLEKAVPNPLGYYGRTKLAGENTLRISGVYYTILRTNVLYGIANSRPDFVRWVVNSLRAGKEIKIVTDQVNNPTYIDDLVQAVSKIIQYGRQGTYNIGGMKFLSRFDFTLMIADYFNLNKALVFPIITAELNQPAKRPLKSGLITIKAQSEIGFKPHTIEESFAEMKKELSL